MKKYIYMLAPLHVPTFWKGWKRLVRCFRRKTAACWKKPLTLQWDTAKFAEKSLTECPEFWNEYMPQSLTGIFCAIAVTISYLYMWGAPFARDN